MKPQLFLDCDGVLADFDTLAIQIFNRHPREAEDVLGTDEFWRQLSSYENFYGHLPLMADAQRLYDTVAHLNPIILTGCPEGARGRSRKRLSGPRATFPESRSSPAAPATSVCTCAILAISSWTTT